MKRLAVVFALVMGLTHMGIAAESSKENQGKSSGSGSSSSPQPSPPPSQEIITRPLTPGTGTYIEHGTHIPSVPYEPPKSK
jgi:hypothetical protein